MTINITNFTDLVVVFKAIDRTFYRFTGVINHAGCWGKYEKSL